MPGPSPKPRDQRARRNKGEGTESTTVVIPTEGRVDWLSAWPGGTVEVDAGDGGLVEIPAPPKGLLKTSRDKWTAYWLAPESQMVRPHHMAALERLARLYDEEERLRRRVAKSRVVSQSVPMGLDGPAAAGDAVVDVDYRAVRIPGHLGLGSQGQLVVSPDFSALMKVRVEIRQLEDRFAASPMAEFRVGWQHAAMLTEQGRAREAQELAAAAAKIAASHEQQLEQGGGP